MRVLGLAVKNILFADPGGMNEDRSLHPPFRLSVCSESTASWVSRQMTLPGVVATFCPLKRHNPSLKY